MTAYETLVSNVGSDISGAVDVSDLVSENYISCQYSNISILILDIINCPVICLKYDVSETGLCLLLLVELTKLSQIDTPSAGFQG
jgi:hypothetical protein